MWTAWAVKKDAKATRIVWATKSVWAVAALQNKTMATPARKTKCVFPAAAPQISSVAQTAALNAVNPATASTAETQAASARPVLKKQCAMPPHLPAQTPETAARVTAQNVSREPV